MTSAARFDFDVSSALNIGARSRQEDALAVAFSEGADHGFAIVSDGMGGHASGDLASRTIVAEMFANLTLGNLENDIDLPQLLQDALRHTNARLASRVKSTPSHSGMGGTVIAAVAKDKKLYWISVGDSVLYLFRNETLSRLNEDHSMAPQIDLMLARGLLTAAEAADHPQRNCLTSALMGSTIAEVDCPLHPLVLKPGDIVILASDGLQFLPDPIIAALLLRAPRDGSRDIVQDLMDAVAMIDDPEQDNTAIIVLRAGQPRARVRQGAFRAKSSAVLRAVRRAVSSPVQMRSRS